MSSSISTRDIVTIAILSALGGALSTFVGYLGNLINLTLGVPQREVYSKVRLRCSQGVHMA